MGNRSGGRDGAGPGHGRRVRSAARMHNPIVGGAARRSVPLPIVLARRVRLRTFAPDPQPPSSCGPRLLPEGCTLDDLLTAWIASARGVHEPDTLDDCGDYARYLDEVNRAAHDADVLCRRLRERLSAWVAVQDGAGCTATPPPEPAG